MRNLTALLILALMISCTSKTTTSLFNGKDLTGWHIDVPEMDTVPNAINPFIVREGMLVSLGEPQGHIITDNVYQNFRLRS